MTTSLLRERLLRTAAHDDDEGTTLVEMLVALVLVAVVLAGLAGAMIVAQKSIGSSDRLTNANQLATARLEQLRQLPWALVAPGMTPPAPVGGVEQTIKGTRFTVATTSGWVADCYNGAAPVAGGPADQDIARFDVAVTWSVAGKTSSVRASTLRTPMRGEKEFVIAENVTAGCS